jgi:hypothetical protein
VGKAFRYHDTTSPEGLCTTVLRTNHHTPQIPLRSSLKNPKWNNLQHRPVGRRQGPTSRMLSRSAISEMTALLPRSEAAHLLLNTYFDRIHWFMLLFHQDEFRTAFGNLLSSNSASSSFSSLGFLTTALAVCAISLQYGHIVKTSWSSWKLTQLPCKKKFWRYWVKDSWKF